MSHSNDSDPKEPDATSELPVVEQEAADPTEELPAPRPAEATKELPSVGQEAEEETAVLPAVEEPPAAARTPPPSLGSQEPSGPEPSNPEPSEEAAPDARQAPKRRWHTVVLSLVIVLLLGVIGVFGGELVARHMLVVCANEAARQVLHTSAGVKYDHSKLLIASLAGHEIPYLSVEATGASVDKFDQYGQVQLREAIKGLDVAARLEDIHVTKDGGSVGHMTARVVWNAEGIRTTLLNRDLKDGSQNESPISSIRSVKFDPDRTEFVLDLDGKIGPVESQAVVVVHPEIDKQHNLKIRIRSIDLPKLHNIAGFDVSAAANNFARPAIEQVAGKIAGYPMGLKAKSVQVKDDAIIFQFYADNAPLVKGTKCSALRWFE